MLTIRPQPRSFMCGHTAWAQLNAPVRLTRRSRSQSSGTWSGSWPRWSSVPALLTRMSTEPNSSTVRRTVSSTCARSVTSHFTAAARRPRSQISCAVDSAYTKPCDRAAWAIGPYRPASSPESDSTWMSAITTSAPALPSVSASARPSPRDPPVTKATRPERSISITGHEQFPCDHEALDLGGALVDLVELGVAHQLLDGELFHVPVAAEDLHGISRDFHADVRGEPLRVRRLERRAHALVDHPRRLPAKQPRSFDLRRHVGDQEVDALVHRDGHAELHALLRVLGRVLERRARDADGPDRRARPREVERLHRDLEALALLAEPVLRGNAHVLERQRGRVGRALSHLVEVPVDHDAVCVGRNDESGQAAMALRLVRRREHR